MPCGPKGGGARTAGVREVSVERGAGSGMRKRNGAITSGILCVCVIDERGRAAKL